MDILNPIGAKPGDRVKIGTDTGKVMLSAFILYMLPLIGAFVLYGVLGSLNISAKIAVVSKIVWFALWFVCYFFVTYERSSVKEFTPLIFYTHMIFIL